MKNEQQKMFNYEVLEHTHDLSLSDWGPYSSRTFGISHIHSKEHGNILDIVLMGGFYRRPLAVPDARRPSGAAAALSTIPTADVIPRVLRLII